MKPRWVYRERLVLQNDGNDHCRLEETLRMRRRAVPSALLAACLMTSCTGTATTPAPELARSSTTPADRAAAQLAPSRSPAVVGKVEDRPHPFTTVDLQGVSMTTVATDTLPLGAPPRLLWRTPRGAGHVYRIRDAVISFPGGVEPAGRFGNGYVAAGGCTRSPELCARRQEDGVHLVSRDGTVTSPYTRAPDERVCCLTISPDGRRLAWVVESASGHRPFRFALGDTSPTELPDPAAAMRAAAPRPVGFVGDDLVQAVVRAGGRTVGYTRTSGRLAEWDARQLQVVARGVLLGEPAFSSTRDTCLSRYPLASPGPRWTRCYTSGGGPAELYASTAGPGGRWLAGMVTAMGGLSQQLLLLDLRTGQPGHRIQFDHELQAVRFEDDGHFLVVLSREDLPGMDPWPVGRIVRCDLALVCERATRDIEITGYDMLGFVGD